MNGSITINYSDDEELVAICKVLATIGVAPSTGLEKLDNAEKSEPATAATVTTFRASTVYTGYDPNRKIGPADTTATVTGQAVIKRSVKKKGSKRQGPKPDAFELKKKGWKVRGPYDAGGGKHKFESIRIINPENYHEFHTYRIGESVRGEHGLTATQVAELLADVEWKKREGSYKDEPKAAPESQELGKYLDVLCYDCKRERKNTDVIKTVQNTRFAEGLIKDAQLKHNALTGHEHFDVRTAREAPVLA